MPKIDDPAGSLPGLVAIDIDISGLDGFAGSINDELAANFTPQAQNLMKAYEPGSHFGIGHTSTDVSAARQRHTKVLQSAGDQLAAYARASQVLVTAARTVALRYRNTDALAAASQLEVQSTLDEAVKASNRIQRDAEAAAMKHAAQTPHHGSGGGSDLAT